MALKYGLIIGAATVLCYIAAYFVSLDWFLSMWLYWGTMLFYFIGMQFLGNHVVSEGIFSFREIVRPLFVCFLIANAVYYIFYYIMITFVDPAIYTEQASRMIAGMEKLKIKEMDTSFKMSAYILSYFQAAIGGFLIASAIAYSKKQS